MPIEVGKEDLISFAEAGRMLGRDSKTVWMYATKGVKSAGDYRLEYVMSGGQMKTSRQAVTRFSDYLTSYREDRSAPSTGSAR